MPDLPDRLATALAERYSIERELGHGGNGTVYLARDRKHDRPVAIKVLTPELALAVRSMRFLREIRIAARLSHPHIVPLFDSGAAGGVLYYVMPYVGGESLRQRLAREGPLPLEGAVRIAREVADALAYAHRHGVVHRDIKPGNILLEDDHARVADFGIARALSAAEGQITETGVSLGTPAYMSPEQAAGGTEIDGRSDIYSLGAMLYEMLAGAVPFTGPTVRAIMSQLFTDPVPRLRQRRDEVPEWLEEAVLKALAKRPADRYTTPNEFAQALAWPAAGSRPLESRAETGGSKSIAVLPFVNMSADPENEYFSDGIAEEIISVLTNVQALRVVSRTSSFAFKGKNADIGEIGRKLNVGTVLEGSVRKAGNQLRVTAQLVNAADGYHLWSEHYDRELKDVFAIQDEIADNIVKALQVVLSEEEKRAIEKVPTVNVRAYEYYLRGRQYFHQFRRTGMQSARRMFERAIETDPRFAIAHAGLADCCAFLYMYWDGSKSNLDGADSASRLALELDPELAEAHASRGFALSLSRQYEGARSQFETAIRLNPKLYDAHYLYARACVQEGRMEDAVQHYEQAARVRPEDYQALLLMQGPLHALGRHDAAKDALRRGLQIAERHLELNPDDARALYLGATALVQLGEVDRGLDWSARACAIDREDPGVLYSAACVYAIGSMPDQAIECLERAVANGFGHREWLNNDTDLDSLRGNPRFQALCAKI